MKKLNILYAFFALVLIISSASCRKEPVAGGTVTQKLAGEWWVQFPDDDEYFGGAGYLPFSTYNTAANSPDSMFVDDLKGIWEIKGKVKIDVSNQTFSAENIVNEYYDSTFSIIDGKILTGAATAPGSGDKTDSISFSFTLSDDDVPGTVHHAAGYKRTGFSEDDH